MPPQQSWGVSYVCLDVGMLRFSYVCGCTYTGRRDLPPDGSNLGMHPQEWHDPSTVRSITEQLLACEHASMIRDIRTTHIADMVIDALDPRLVTGSGQIAGSLRDAVEEICRFEMFGGLVDVDAATLMVQRAVCALAIK